MLFFFVCANFLQWVCASFIIQKLFKKTTEKFSIYLVIIEIHMIAATSYIFSLLN